MLPFRKKQQDKFLKVGTSCLALLVGLVLWVKAYQSAFDLYKTPSELSETIQSNVRLGGYITKGSISYGQDSSVLFALSDEKASILISYQGAVPSLFQEGVQAIAIGDYDGTIFMAKELLVKHDQNYRLKKAEPCY